MPCAARSRQLYVHVTLLGHSHHGDVLIETLDVALADHAAFIEDICKADPLLFKPGGDGICSFLRAVALLVTTERNIEGPLRSLVLCKQ
ncbi:hypothetical protein SDC9_43141 [bioreactor metagenome]|uniref:Uncharacterized protein n=1 Tax=bioreactor metagenome TaxID=1076179 RepID=A0A644W0C8_9ZZZZ